VGIGLAKLFSASGSNEFFVAWLVVLYRLVSLCVCCLGLEDAIVGDDVQCANSMGLFLQKTNIIRDYLEDLVDGRTWWPAEVWKKYAKSLADFRQPFVCNKICVCVFL
jgi:hypothetical protein